MLADLRDRLSRTRLAPDEGVGWERGTDTAYLYELVTYWRDGFDWLAQQDRLNTMSHFLAVEDGVTMHFAHWRTGGTPIVLVHGWPSGFPEMTRLAPLLAERGFDVVVPSLPGFGFSGPQPVGFGYHRAASMLHRLMTEGLGYGRYGLHGTGLAPFVNGWIAYEHPESVIGYHTHDPSSFPVASFDPPARPPTAAELAARARSAEWAKREGAYAELQRTKPMALGFALNDSPAGLAAWLVEKHRTWSDCNGDVERRYSKDDLLTGFTTYWVTQTIASSMRAYYERTHYDPPYPVNVRVPVPTGVAMPRSEPGFPPRHVPRELAERCHDIRHWVDLPSGGHFVSWEEPALVAQSVVDFFGGLA